MGSTLAGLAGRSPSACLPRVSPLGSWGEARRTSPRLARMATESIASVLADESLPLLGQRMADMFDGLESDFEAYAGSVRSLVADTARASSDGAWRLRERRDLPPPALRPGSARYQRRIRRIVVACVMCSVVAQLRGASSLPRRSKTWRRRIVACVRPAPPSWRASAFPRSPRVSLLVRALTHLDGAPQVHSMAMEARALDHDTRQVVDKLVRASCAATIPALAVLSGLAPLSAARSAR